MRDLHEPVVSPVHMRDVRSSPPYALLLSVLLIIAFELWFRSWPIARRVAYREDGDQTTAVRNQIDAGPMPDVALVGSSMMYQGVAVPELERRLVEEVGHDVGVGNFAVRGGRIDLSEAVVREMLRQPVKPKLIVVGIAMRDLREHDLDLDRLSLMWSLADWKRESKQAWLTDQLPQVIRNEAGRSWQTLRCRESIKLAAQRLLIDLPREPMPARGDRPTQHEGSRREKSLANELKAFAGGNMKRRMIQTYRPELPAKSPRVLSDRIGVIIDQCHRADVKLMFVDLPLSQPLRDLLISAQRKTATKDASKDFDVEYRKVVNRWTRRGHVPFIQWEHRRVTWPNEIYFDGQHLNFAGAVKMSERLAPLIANLLKTRGEEKPSS